MCTIYSWSFQNLFFFVIKKIRFGSRYVLGFYKHYNLSNSFLRYFSISYEVPQVLQRRMFQWREHYIHGAAYSVIWCPKLLKKLRISWFYQYPFSACFVELPISVYPELNRWKTDMISDPSRYLMLIVGLYQRSVPFFLYLLQFNF